MRMMGVATIGTRIKRLCVREMEMCSSKLWEMVFNGREATVEWGESLQVTKSRWSKRSIVRSGACAFRGNRNTAKFPFGCKNQLDEGVGRFNQFNVNVGLGHLSCSQANSSQSSPCRVWPVR